MAAETNTRRAVAIDTLAGYREFIEEIIEERGVPGLAVAVVREDEIVFSEGFGYRNVETEVPITPETLFPIASVTKSFTGTAAAVLVDDGLLAWDTPVREYVRSFELYDRFATEHVTMRDLLSHVTGMTRNDAMWANRVITRKELFDRLRYLEPFADIRTVYHYSNLGYMAAGYIIGEVAGSSWEDVVQTRLFDPLEMQTSRYDIWNWRDWENVARAHALREDQVQLIDYYERQEAIGPCGRIVSCAGELANWLRLHINHGRFGGKRIISDEQMHQLQIVQAPYGAQLRYPELPGGSSGYALGWSVDEYLGHWILNHGGGINGFSTWAAVMPDTKVGVVVLCNQSGVGDVTRTIGRNIFDRFLGVPEVPWRARYKQEAEEQAQFAALADAETAKRQAKNTAPSHELDEYTGPYGHPAYGTLTIALADGMLVGSFNDYDFSLEHFHYDRFRIVNAAFEAQFADFHTAFNGEISSVAIPFDATSPAKVFERRHEVDAAVHRALPSVFELQTGERFTMWPKDERTIVASLPNTDLRLASFVAESEFSFIPATMDPAQFGITFVKNESGDVDRAFIRIWAVVIPARRLASG